jgi:hypothetical protein
LRESLFEKRVEKLFIELGQEKKKLDEINNELKVDKNVL